jgi:Domain of unknown function (DUF4384)
MPEASGKAIRGISTDDDGGRGIARWSRSLLASLFAATLTACVPRPPPASEFLRGLAQEGYTPNAGLSRLYAPGNVIQTAEMGPGGGPKALSPPLVVVWASECFPGQEPRESPFAVAAESGRSSRALSLNGPAVLSFLPGLNLQAGGVSEHRLTLENPRVRAFAKADLSGRLSPQCVSSLSGATKAGDRPEWFAVVVEAVVVDSLRLEIRWSSGVDFSAREQLTANAAQALNAVAGTGSARGAGAKIAWADETTTSIELGGAAIVAYRARPLQATYAHPAADAVPQQIPRPGLRESFQGASGPSETAAVGRLAVRYLTGGSYRRVRLDHPFRSGDAFQFEVTSNRSGWLFVLHAAPGEQPKLLWPRLGARHGEILDRNEIRAQQSVTVPPDPGFLRFDDRAGPELFYVVIRPEREPPRLGAATAAGGSAAGYLASATVPGAGGDAIVQFAVRSGSGGLMRGVVFDPGTQDPDPSVYFTPAPGDGSQDAVFEFRLTHEW